ncbi:MAG: hypothetical protein Q8M66_04090 [Actinomycetota bacterium]|nr:hypothetical protein [Actinomycetota bacterium]
MNDFLAGLKHAAVGTCYGYFAPLTAAYLVLTRPGHYLWHIRALYRLSFRK